MRRNHSGIRHNHDITTKLAAMLTKKTSQIAAADFFFAFDDEVKIHRQFVALFHRFLHAEDVR